MATLRGFSLPPCLDIFEAEIREYEESEQPRPIAGERERREEAVRKESARERAGAKSGAPVFADYHT